MKQNYYFKLSILFVFSIFLSNPLIFAQKNLLQSGPMVGYSAMREVLLWVQTSEPATVYFEYWEKSQPQKRNQSESYVTKKVDAFVAKIVIDNLEPSTKYEYELFINGKKAIRNYPLAFQTQELWNWRKEPPDFKFAFGSCAYINEDKYDRPGTPYGGSYEIFTSIYEKKPDFMLWGGDNIYLREVDYDSRSGILHRNTHARSLPELQPLLGSVHHYAIWDDHDFGPNDADRGYAFKDLTTEAFRLFWGNPNYGVGTDGKGICGTFYWADVQFFLLDNRYFRTPNDNHVSKREVLGEQQINWLIDALTYSQATFKFVVIGGQVINPAQVFENYATYPEEREKLLSLIRQSGVKGVFFLSGDRHHTELSMLKENDKVYPLYDLTVSPLTSGTANPRENNTNRVENTLIRERNFATLQVTGERKNRKLTITIFDTKGKELWKKEILAQDLANN
ncbi:alkaline phosphatase D family protein [Thermoflexibacter ruber]|uniref:Alkaline phosphatase D n=1 Tax=Thermoflexibacter ruber TaxID=1003 RepID=A0A1I2AVF1_9BACT|nr:alkaline phosphatase D family protein [Thermoflexibacter ruber]SFE47985.1 alkaline phosphatase D [Thermoflexibacter ruber]